MKKYVGIFIAFLITGIMVMYFINNNRDTKKISIKPNWSDIGKFNDNNDFIINDSIKIKCSLLSGHSTNISNDDFCGFEYNLYVNDSLYNYHSLRAIRFKKLTSDLKTVEMNYPLFEQYFNINVNFNIYRVIENHISWILIDNMEKEYYNSIKENNQYLKYLSIYNDLKNSNKFK